MTPSAPSQPKSPAANNLPLALGLAVVILFFVASGIVSYRNTTFVLDDARQVAHTHEVIVTLDNVLSLMKDAESGQRGFVLTGDEKYLEPFYAASTSIAEELGRIESLTKADPSQMESLPPLKQHVAAKFAELEETINLRRTGGFEAARAVVVTDRGKFEMDALRATVAKMETAENVLRAKRVEAMHDAYRSAVISGVLSALLGIALSVIVACLIQRTLSARRRQEWLQSGKLGLASAMFGEQRVDRLGGSILDFLAKYLDAHAGAFFSSSGGHFKRIATYGVPAGSDIPERFLPGDGLLGQAAAGKGESILIKNVPEGYLTVGSSLGRSTPRHLVISSAASDNAVNAVFELGFIHPIGGQSLEFLGQVSESIGVAVKSALYRENLQEFLEETQRQAEELQAQSEELRVNNEELEEQSRALKESQTRLEQQQAELEQTNSQLEEQTQLLEIQKDDLSRAKSDVQAKADEVERASRYKSDFLANMSHELRTPLNSSLILSKLLADNPANNLTAEQVKYAQTIQSSGNDLLALINDILDLSKIESGHMEVHPEPVSIARLVGDLERTFDPIAGQKGITFTTTIAEDCPEMIETDRQRFEQVVKNLLSNAIKFTERGRVELSVTRTAPGRLAFAVSDTGIGISEEKQHDVFEAFHQADGTISRKYGGTGLGLSISRELARLLGGTIELQSTPGNGSTFTFLLPERYNAGNVLPREIPEPVAQPLPPPYRPVATSAPGSSFIADDRENLVAGGRTILVVEDDPSFARILHDLAREIGFQCLIASTAEDALAIARQYLPNAVLLDVGLPDNSGLSVLDRLKQDKRTRHIPVHVVSAGDHSKTALSLGAIGYMIKPVKHEDIVEALKQIEVRIAGGMRQVLIVEDDPVQRDSLAKLLGSSNVETVAVGTAAECLQRLKESTFDCMVLDLSLPDASGYSLLETLSKEDTYSFPPVIVYTGRDLSAADEQKLRRYSKSIIIKGAKSPERLLDEVTLFLHRVVSELPPEQQQMLEKAHNRDAILEQRRILVVEDDVRNIYALTNILEPRGALVQIARNGREALDALEKSKAGKGGTIDLVLMDVMMPEMDGLTATREIRAQPEWKRLPIIMLTAKAMKSDQERCLEAGANDYMAKPLDVEKLLSLVRVWMPR
jgi:CheY-like chemotaxis protein/CHASE3 domain sensor protein